MMEDSKKVATRVKRYRERTTTERLEIIGVLPELKEMFRTLPGLEDVKAADRLQALVDLWLSHHGKAHEQPAAAAPLATEDQARQQRREIDRWFSESWRIILPSDRAKKRYWQHQMRENQELRTAVQVLDRRIHPQFSEALKKNLIPILPSQILALASLEPERTVELAHLAFCGGKDPIDAIEVRLQELRRQKR